MISNLRTIVLLSGILIILGCYGGGAPEYEGTLEPVTGIVSINGNPESGIEIMFMPLQGTSGTGAFARTGEGGAFTLKHRSGQADIEKGKYKVLFSKFIKPDGSPIGPDDDAATAGIEQLPSIYTNEERSKIIEEVPTGGKKFEFDLKIKSRK